MPVAASLRALLNGIIDYAGLFPPAALALEPALQNYVRYRQEPEGWMLSRFICRVTDLPEVSKQGELLAQGPPLAFSAIGVGGDTGGGFGCNLFAEENAIYTFRHAHKERVTVDRFEALAPVFVNLKALPIPLDLDLPKDPSVTAGIILESLIFNVAAILGGKPGFDLLPFLEMPATPNWRSVMGSVIATLGRKKEYPSGFKLRCGGAGPGAVPPAEQIAFVLTACRKAGIPVKFTAGLHHPLRHDDAKQKTKAHGFINVFVAGVLAHARQLPEDQLIPILEDEDPQSFRFDADALHWRDQTASVGDIVAAREQVTSFGSCSFDEPRADLRGLGWLP